MKERPILFSGPMVRAILEGRKTQTRRACKFTSAGHLKAPQSHKRWHPEDPNAVEACPYGQPGDRLWVKETFHAIPELRDVYYRASEPADRKDLKWKPSIYMPRWASRITLEIVSVRVERLQDISEEDAKAEGAEPYNAMLDIGTKGTPRIDAGPYQKGYALLWGEINGLGSWEANPWVWVVEFKHIK